MKQDHPGEVLETSLKSNLWVQRWSIIFCLFVCIVAIIAQFNFLQFVELLFGAFLFGGIFFFGFLGIFLHIKYYYKYERNRKIELSQDGIKIYIHGKVDKQISKTEIIKIVLYDNLKSEGYNLFPTNLDRFYYLTIFDKKEQQLVLTCLIDIKLKMKIKKWYGCEPEHKYKFFPLP